MLKLSRPGKTFGIVVAGAVVIAVASTGGAVASGLITSAKIKNNTIQSIDVRNNNLTGADVKDGSLGGADVADGSLSGADLAAGVLSNAVTSSLPSGKTVRGTIGGMSENLTTGQETGYTASLPVPAPVALDDTHVAVDGSDEPAGACPGTATNPTAAPGFVCIYPFNTNNAAAGTGFIWGSDAAANEMYGFQLSVDALGNGAVTYMANWAYTAP